MNEGAAALSAEYLSGIVARNTAANENEYKVVRQTTPNDAAMTTMYRVTTLPCGIDVLRIWDE